MIAVIIITPQIYSIIKKIRLYCISLFGTVNTFFKKEVTAIKFEYPHKYYQFGFFIFLAACVWALYNVLIIETSIFLKIIFVAVIVLVIFGLRRYYQDNAYKYSAFGIELHPDHLNIRFDREDYVYTLDEVNSIYLVEQVENVKLYKLVHVFTSDDKHFSFSNEMIHFKKLNNLLKEMYPEKVKVIDHLLKNFKRQDEDAFLKEFNTPFISKRQLKKEKKG
jgi:hypothetical protein